MKITFEGKIYTIEDEYITSKLNERIDAVLGKKIKLPNGPTIDLSSKGVISTILRQLMVMFLLPVVEWAAYIVQVPLPRKEKHGDSIRYTLQCYIAIVQKLASQSNMILYTDVVNGEQKITGIKIAEIVDSVRLPNEESVSNGQNNIP